MSTCFKATNRKISCVFHVDVDWKNPAWMFSFSKVSALLSEEGVPFGVICNASAGATSAAAWMNSGTEATKKSKNSCDDDDDGIGPAMRGNRDL
jgi:hypothetical protein